MAAPIDDDCTQHRAKSERGRGVRWWERIARISEEHPLLCVWAGATALFFGLSAVWSLATPIDATNDEGAQVVKAVSVVRGEVLGSSLNPTTEQALSERQLDTFKNCVKYLHAAVGVGDAEGALRCANAFTIVTVPKSFSSFPPSKVCNSLPIAPDSCPTHLNGSDQPVKAITYVGRYPPLYYAIVGLPSLLSQTDAAIYGMRLVSGLLSAVMFGLSVALVAIWSTRRLLLVAVAVSATPMVLVFGSTINPSGLEMSAALCTWTGLLILVLEYAERPPPSLVGACTAAATVFALTRALSPLWLFFTVLFVIALKPHALRSLAADGRVRIGSAVVIAAVLVAVIYVVWAKSLNVMPAGSPVPYNASLLQLVQTALGRTGNYIAQFAGAFGWGLANPPLVAVILLFLAVSAVVLGGLVTGEGRKVVKLAALFVGAMAMTFVLIVSQASKDGVVWQARDGFPLYCGVILVAGAIIRTTSQPLADPDVTRSFVERRLVVIVVICVAGAQLTDLLWAIRRYTVGLWGPLNVFAHVRGGFRPPVPTALLVIAALVLCAVYGRWLVRLSWSIPSASRGSGHKASGLLNLEEQWDILPETSPRVPQ